MPRVAEIRAIERKDGRKHRYGIAYPLPGGKRRKVFRWTTKAARDEQLAMDRRMAVTEGTAGMAASAADMRLLADLREMLPDNVDAREAVRFYLDHHRAVAEVSLNGPLQRFCNLIRQRIQTRRAGQYN